MLIRDVDMHIYARFKAKAAELGLKVGEALTQALIDWIETNRPSSPEEAERMRNFAAYRRMKPTLLANHSGEWALIHAEELICLKNSFEEIIQVINAKNLDGHPCLVFKVGEPSHKRTFGIGKRIKRER